MELVGIIKFACVNVTIIIFFYFILRMCLLVWICGFVQGWPMKYSVCLKISSPYGLICLGLFDMSLHREKSISSLWHR